MSNMLLGNVGLSACPSCECIRTGADGDRKQMFQHTIRTNSFHIESAFRHIMFFTKAFYARQQELL